MLKKILAILAMLYAFAAFAAVDVNKATAADLDGIKGIGPSTSKAIIDERKKGGDFKSWEDLISRVKGIAESKAASLSKEGLTVNGADFKKAAAKDAKADAKADKKETKPAAKDAKKDDKTAAAAQPAASPAKPAASAAKPAASAKK